MSTASTIQAPAQTIDQATLAVAVQESVAAGTPLLVAVENVAAANSISFDTVFAAVCTAVRVEKFGQ